MTNRVYPNTAVKKTKGFLDLPGMTQVRRSRCLAVYSIPWLYN